MGEGALQIRRILTEKTVCASDKRSVFLGLGAYEAAGGIALRDLFEQDGGGWHEDVALLDGLAAAKPKAEAERIAAEGWKWVEVATEFPYGSKPKDGDGGQTRKRAEWFFVNGFRG